ncbi:MAG: flagellar basal body protein [Planctomycetaceae bacterium]
MNSFSIGLTALRAHQQSLEILGNNVANASTPGYHRQRPELVNDVGVRVARITRMKNDSVETALLRNNSLSGYSQQSLDVATQIESILTPSETSIHANISEFFNRLEKVANAPQDMSVRAEMLSSAQELTNGFAHLDQALLELDGDTHAALEDGLAEVNRLITHIADINQQIFIARGQQKEPTICVDQRDA